LVEAGTNVDEDAIFSMGNGAGGFRDRIGMGDRLWLYIKEAVTLGLGRVGIEEALFS
jgi:hypothetical protein